MKYNIELTGPDAMELLKSASMFAQRVRDRARDSEKERRDSARAYRRYYIDECANLFVEIDDMRMEIETFEAMNAHIDLGCASGGLEEMLDKIYPAHRGGEMPYSDALVDLAYDVLEAVEKATREIREAYDTHQKAEAESMRTGVPVFDRLAVAGG